MTEKDVSEAQNDLVAFSARSPVSFALVAPSDVHGFDFLFPTLQEDDDNLLPQSATMPALLKVLGAAMVDADQRGQDSPIPAAYTYFGQFVDHDITFEVQPADLPDSASGAIPQLLDAGMTPLPPDQIRNALRNFRTPTLDLDSVYGPPAPRDPTSAGKMKLGTNAPLGGQPPPRARPAGKGLDNDLPREGPREGNTLHDRAALIGDPRNDENTVISQLHVAFLKAHNALIDRGLTFDEARRVLRQHYQHIVIHDFLKRIADPAIVDDVVINGNRWFDAEADPFFMPLEFSVAGYRFGHTMVRAAYNFNVNFNFAAGRPATLELLFTFSALAGELGGADTLPENWIIEWENIIGDDAMKARRIDTTLAATGDVALFRLTNLEGSPETPPDAARLAVRNLLRGYRLRLPTGQAVAELLGLPVLSKDDLLAAAGSPEQVAALESGGFVTRTPLWYYLLAEAAHHGGERLGPVGSTIAAEVLVGLVRRSEESILKLPGWTPSLPAATPGTFELADLLRFAGVLGRPEPPRTYTVRRGDTLSGIAEAELSDRRRWTEIFLLNRAIIRNPDRIFAGQVLTLPPAQPTGPIPVLYVVRPGDSLSTIAQAQLGDRNRWPEIFARNRDIISNPDRIIPGQVLVLPS